MKTFLVLTIFFIFITINSYTEAQWVQTNGLNNLAIQCLSIKDSCLFAGTTDNGVFFSKNNGENWSTIDNGLPPGIGSITSFAQIDSNLYTGAGGVYVLKSKDTTWASTGLVNYYITSLASIDTTLFAAYYYEIINHTTYGLSVSKDKGINWTSFGGPSDVFSFLESHDSVGNLYVFAGTLSGAYVSVDTGKNWNSSGLSGKIVFAMAKVPAGPDTQYLFAATGNGIFLSTDNGTSWKLSGLGDVSIASLLVYPENANKYYIFAGALFNTLGNIFVSTDNGKNWKSISRGLPNVSIQALSSNGNFLFAGTVGAGVWRRPLSEITSIKVSLNKSSLSFVLEQNYPNPFNPSTIIKYTVSKTTFITITIYDVTGKKLNTLVSQVKQPGNYNTRFNASGLSSGVYFCRMQAGNFTDTKKLLYIK